MAIVPMNKIFIAGMNGDRAAVMENLLGAGVVQIEDFSAEELEPYQNMAGRPSVVGELNSIEDRLYRAKTAIEALSRYSVEKKPLFGGKKAVTRRQYQETVAQKKTIFQMIDTVCHYEDELEQIRKEQNHIDHRIEQLHPFERLDIPLDLEGTKRTVVMQGSIPALFNGEELKEEVRKEGLAAEIVVLAMDDINIYLNVICHADDLEALNRILEEKGFSRILFEDGKGTASERIAALSHRKKELADRAEHTEKDINSMVDSLPAVKILADHLANQKEKTVAVSSLLETESSFLLRGWLPARACDTLEKFLTEHYDNIVVEISPPEEGEEYPILLQNNKLVQPFEMVTELYSLPRSYEVDPNPTMAVFYFVFFGLMLSDAGYGIVLSLLTGFMLWRYKPEGMMDKLMKLLFLGGISTTFWGIMFGGWFGDLFASVPLFQPVWFNPINDPMTLLLWSFVFGAVQLFTGMAVRAYMMIRDGHWLDAVFDVGFWYVFLIGLVLLFVAPGIGKYLAIGGAAGLILTQGRQEKNVFMKLAKGVMSLYDVTSYLSDVLSYSRLLALGLATGVIAQVVNTMGRLVGTSFIGIVAFVLILIVGHTFNIAINTLGAYVHASRLQYVEYFGKFYSGGGEAFRPLARKTKYITIK